MLNTDHSLNSENKTYVILKNVLCNVYCQYCEENWLCYNEIQLYHSIHLKAMPHVAGNAHPLLIKSPQSGLTLRFQFVSTAASAAAAAAMTFASHVKTIWALP